MDFSEVFENWEGVAVAVLVLSSLVAALGYMIASFLQSEKLKAWSKLEVSEILYSMVILAAIVFGVELTESALGGWLESVDPAGAMVCGSTEDQACHILIAKDYFNALFYEVYEFNFELSKNYMWLSLLGSISLGSHQQLTENRGAVSLSPFAGVSTPATNIITTLFNYMISTAILLKFQEIIVDYTASVFFPMFLVIGLLLRSFYFTRRLGGLMMAIALALYFIFPVFIDLGAIAYHTAAKNSGTGLVFTNINFDEEDLLKNLEAVGGGEGIQTAEELKELEGVVEGDRLNMLKVDLNKYSEMSKELATALEFCAERAAPSEGEYDETESNLEKLYNMLKKRSLVSELEVWISFAFGEGGVVDVAAHIITFSFLFSFLGLMAVISAIKVLSPMLGGDVAIAGLAYLL